MVVAEHVESITMKSGLLVELNGNENFAEDIHFRQSKMAVGAGGIYEVHLCFISL